MKIVFNGSEYGGVEEMPPAVRQEYLSLIKAFGGADAGGIPGLLQRSEERIVVDETITYNGREYRSRSELPPEAQQLLERLPPPQPGGAEPRLEVNTKVLPPKVEIVSTEFPEVYSIGGSRRSFPWLLVLFLLAIIGALAWLWVAGVRPKELFRH